MDALDRLIAALDSTAAELEQLRLLKEYELGVRIEHHAGGGDPYMIAVDTGEEES